MPEESGVCNVYSSRCIPYAVLEHLRKKIDHISEFYGVLWPSGATIQLSWPECLLKADTHAHAGTKSVQICGGGRKSNTSKTNVKQGGLLCKLLINIRKAGCRGIAAAGKIVYIEGGTLWRPHFYGVFVVVV